MSNLEPFVELHGKISNRTAKVGVIGLGYVGLPLATAIARAGFPTIGFDIDPVKIQLVNAERSYIDAVASVDLTELKTKNLFSASGDFSRLSVCDVIVICVPTPLTRHRDPDLSYIDATGRTISRHLRCGQMIILESTTFPGTTRDLVRPILEDSGLKSGVDFFLGYSPEREDPGNETYRTATIPKVVAGDGEKASTLVQMFYGAVVRKVVPVATPAVAEAVKITENVFRAVNIALVNELKIIFDAMGIDIWDVIDAAASKPFGYLPFYPGPGLGGHCIPIDPFYLSWKAKEHDISTRFIELAGEINLSMPQYVINKLEEALDRRSNKTVGSAYIVILGVAYKKNIGDIRESPSLKIMELLENRGARLEFHDPLVPVIPATREYRRFEGRKSVPLDADRVKSADALIVLTDHDCVDYALIAENGRLVIDTRNVFARRALKGRYIVKA